MSDVACIQPVGPLLETAAEVALRGALDQHPGEHDVCTVNQRYLADVLSTLRVLRQVHDLHQGVIDRFTRPVATTTAVAVMSRAETALLKGAGL